MFGSDIRFEFRWILRYRNWFDDFCHRQYSTDFNTCCQCQHSHTHTHTRSTFATYIFCESEKEWNRSKQSLLFPYTKFTQSRLTTHSNKLRSSHFIISYISYFLPQHAISWSVCSNILHICIAYTYMYVVKVYRQQQSEPQKRKDQVEIKCAHTKL